jgi:hypothetical protein
VIESVPVPHDCSDGFCSAYWRRPTAYLDPRVRSGVSYFSILDEVELEHGLELLRRDLASNVWDRGHGQLMSLDDLDIGQRLIVAGVLGA